MCGTVEDGIVPGLWGSGRANPPSAIFLPGSSSTGAGLHSSGSPQIEGALPGGAGKTYRALKPGQSGLLALDWWNGNRSVLVDVDLTGMMLGMTLQTRAEEIYRPMIEATAFGTRTIMEKFQSNGVTVNELVASGGFPEKTPC